jgi:hypothetical protein
MQGMYYIGLDVYKRTINWPVNTDATATAGSLRC